MNQAQIEDALDALADCGDLYNQFGQKLNEAYALLGGEVDREPEAAPDPSIVSPFSPAPTTTAPKPSVFAQPPTIVPAPQNLTFVESIQTKLKAAWDPSLEVDDAWGPASTAACQAYLRSLMPSPHPFPTQRQTQAGNSIYGPVGVKDGYTPPMVKVPLPFPVYLYGDKAKPRQELPFHEACAPAFHEFFQRLFHLYPTEAERWEAGVVQYYGIYNPRPTRGGRSPSMHSWAIAIDLDANRNGNKSSWPTFSHMPLEVFEAAAKCGIRPAGAFWSRDAMHLDAVAA